MANAEIDIKDVTDKMESGDGCALLFNKVFQSLNKDFDAQMSIVKKVEEEAKSRPDSKLTFEPVDKVGQDPITKKLVDLYGVNVRLPDDVLVFTELKVSEHETKRPMSVAKGCKPGPGDVEKG